MDLATYVTKAYIFSVRCSHSQTARNTYEYFMCQCAKHDRQCTYGLSLGHIIWCILLWYRSRKSNRETNHFSTNWITLEKYQCARTWLWWQNITAYFIMLRILLQWKMKQIQILTQCQIFLDEICRLGLPAYICRILYIYVVHNIAWNVGNRQEKCQMKKNSTRKMPNEKKFRERKRLRVRRRGREGVLKKRAEKRAYRCCGVFIICLLHVQVNR